MNIQDEVHEISPRDAYKQVQNGHALLFDIRCFEEVEFEGWISEAYFLPYELLEADKMIMNLEFSQHFTLRYLEYRKINRLLLFICGNGRRSVEAVRCLRKMGYQTVASVTGGVVSWVASGLPIKRVLYCALDPDYAGTI